MDLGWKVGRVREEKVFEEYTFGTVGEFIEKLQNLPSGASIEISAERSYYDSVDCSLVVYWYRDLTPEELEEKVAADLKQKRNREQAEYRQLNELAKRLGKKIV